MMTDLAAAAPHELRVLIFAPRGRDAEVAQKVLSDARYSCVVCQDVSAFLAEMNCGAAVGLMTEEALGQSEAKSVNALFNWLDRQPTWSDFPLIMLAVKQAGPRPESALQTLQRLGNVVLLERPINIQTLLSAVGASLRMRRRQYEARRHLIEREKVQDELRAARDELELRVNERTRALEGARRYPGICHACG